MATHNILGSEVGSSFAPAHGSMMAFRARKGLNWAYVAFPSALVGALLAAILTLHH